MARVYYLLGEYAPGKHRPIAAARAAELPIPTGNMAPHGYVEIPEIEGPNNNMDQYEAIKNTLNRTDDANEPEYYIGSNGEVERTVDWVESQPPE